MEDFSKSLKNAKKIDEGLFSLSNKWLYPGSINGSETDVLIGLDELQRKLDCSEEILDSMIASMDRKISITNLVNEQKEQSLLQIKSEVTRIEELGRDAGFHIPPNIQNISPVGSPSEMSYQGTPLSSISFASNCGQYNYFTSK